MKFTLKAFVLTLTTVLTWQNVQAKTLVISDMDDTIKNSHVLSSVSSIGNMWAVDNLVMGMNSLYQLLAADIPDAEFTYLSNAPDLIMARWHTKFLTRHNFPAGSLLMRNLSLDPAHKLNNISKLIESEKPDLVILIGDNGEKDVEIYNAAVLKYPRVRILTYIHMLYYSESTGEMGKTVLGQQKEFATALDLMLSLLDQGIISAHNAEKFVENFATNLAVEPKIESDGILAFPRWMDCRDVTLDASPILKLPESNQQLALTALSTVHERCLIPRYQY